MEIQQNVSLQAHSTMRLGGQAAYLCEVKNKTDIPTLVDWAKQRQLPILMIGDGSNIVWRDEGFGGLLLVNRIAGFEINNQTETGAYFTIGAGENWDSVVERCAQAGYNGISELSLIPGTAGATPVQNVGAYGKEIRDTLIAVEAFDLETNQFVTVIGSECGFGYRTSRFKTTDRGRFLITAITLMLTKDKPLPPFYDSVAEYLNREHITSPTTQDIRTAVVAIRSAKLPDVRVTANNGSFFANPIVEQADFTQLLADFPNIRYWRTDDDQTKLSAAWLIEQAGFKNYTDKETGMATWPDQPLVLVNEHAKNTADLLRFKQKIVDAVREKFGITLQQEPEILPQVTS